MRFNIPAFLTSLAATFLIHQAGAVPITDVQNAGVEHSSNWPYYNSDLLDEKSQRAGKRNIAKLTNPGQQTQYASYKEHYHEGDLEGRGKYKRKNAAFSTEFWPNSVLNILGVKKADKYTSVSIFSNEQINPRMQSQQPMAEKGFLPNNSIIIAKSNFKNKDFNPTNQQIPPAEIMLQVWDELAGNKKDDLTWIAHSHIVNEGTKGIIDQAFMELNKNDKELLHVTEKDHLEDFQALSGTPNCKGVYPTLANHGSTRSTRVTDLYVSKESGN